MSTKRREYEYGRIVSVDIVPLGDNLAADASSGATSITVEDACDFDEDGGLLLLDGIAYAYETWTEDETTGIGTIALADTLSANATEGTEVAVYDPMYATAASDKVCQVEVSGDDGNTDTLEAALALHLVDKLDEGIRGPNGEQVKLELEGDEWVIVDIFGLGDPATSGGQKFRNTDTLAVAATGTQTFTLTYEPIAGSEHIRWHPAGKAGLDLLASEWSRAGKVVTIGTPNYAESGDVYDAAYAYLKGPHSAVATIGDLLETVNIDPRTDPSSNPKVMTTVLTAGTDYYLKLDGTFTVWGYTTLTFGSHTPIKYLASGQSQKDSSHDSEFIIGDPSSSCPIAAPSIMWNLGSGWVHTAPVGGAPASPDPASVYWYQIVGTGSALSLSMTDANPSDDSGLVEASIYEVVWS